MVRNRWAGAAAGLAAALAVAVTVAVALALAGCGQLPERQRAADAAAADFERALTGRQGDALCEALAPSTRQEPERSADQPCPEAAADLKVAPGGAAVRTEVWGDQAHVVLADDTLFPARPRDGWKVTAAGCEPQPGQPYECGLKAG
ncbi:hypothetical protein K353_00827 [Kitasatospora sp. SolWspMP-SS2h]|uniref:hypothetical protein n=1 Tax=Kitasatospora sp. SolWspMP-SS2h TaxID=1305729 RepID=UPI000DC048EE|nr:hypothetical protein [Kitasatospora sp. SolWspMP-SS2h]RAJ45329.1 hypothetical protein K353_00827 [Kitasatospora sp. SolWspMP-SS2h]